MFRYFKNSLKFGLKELFSYFSISNQFASSCNWFIKKSGETGSLKL
jgi:hypothetical protein